MAITNSTTIYELAQNDANLANSGLKTCSPVNIIGGIKIISIL